MAVVATILAIGLGIAPPLAGTAQAAGPLRLEVDATYTLDPEAGRVHVVMDVEATNLKPNAGNVVYYYRDIFFGIHPEATRIRAGDDTGSLGTTIRRRAHYVEVSVRLRSLIFYRDSARFRIRYDLAGGEPRSESRIRVGAAFATFGVWSWGDPGASSVEVRTPRGFGSQVFGDPMQIVNDLEGQRLRARPADPATFYAVVNAENLSAYDRSRISLEGGVELVILAWPEDPAWHDTVATTLETGMPVLQELIGLDWPVDHDLEVRERFTPLLEGYAGVFYGDESIDVSEDLDQLVIVHEASHAWFRPQLFAERWITEGLAQEYAWLVVTRTGGDPPEDPTPPTPGDPGEIKLTSWTHPGVIRDEETSDAERYGYGAAWWVIHEIVATVGEERMREAFAAAEADVTAYPGVGAPERVSTADGWTRLLDLVEDPTTEPSRRIDEVFERWVLTSSDARRLERRDEARAAYRELLEAGDGWLPPWYVRAPMGTWTFDVAERRIDEAEAVLELREQVDAAAAPLDLQPNGDLRISYERADGDFEPARAIAAEQLASLSAIDEARLAIAAERDLFTTVGLLDATPEASYGEARAAFEAGRLEDAVTAASAAAAIIAGAAGVGQGRVVLAAGITAAVLLLLVLAVALLLRRRGRRHAAAAAVSVGPAVPEPPAAVSGRVSTEAYATLAADPTGAVLPAGPALEGGTAEGGSPVDDR